MLNQPLTLTTKPVTHLRGQVVLPGDKSISHRAVIFAAIANGNSTIQGFLYGLDCLATVNALRLMGVSITQRDDGALLVEGRGKYGLNAPSECLHVGNAGTALRLLCGLLAAQDFDSVLMGDSSLSRRPMARIVTPLLKMGAKVESNEGHAPLEITGGQSLVGIDYTLPVASAQLKSCLLIAGLYAEGETSITEPVTTRDHTERLLTSFQYPLKKSDGKISLNSTSQLQATSVMIPGCLSSAAFFIVAATITPGSELTLRDVGINPTRLGLIRILEKMGAKLRLTNKRLWGEEPVADIEVCYSPLEGIEIPIEWVSLAIDEFPVLFIAAAVAKGQTLLRGATELRFKESDRIQVMVDGLLTLGIDAESLADGAIIHGGTLCGGVIDSHGDHRIAMAFAVAGSIAKSPIQILNCDNIATSFPDFERLANKVGMAIYPRSLKMRSFRRLDFLLSRAIKGE